MSALASSTGSWTQTSVRCLVVARPPGVAVEASLVTMPMMTKKLPLHARGVGPAVAPGGYTIDMEPRDVTALIGSIVLFKWTGGNTSISG